MTRKKLPFSYQVAQTSNLDIVYTTSLGVQLAGDSLDLLRTIAPGTVDLIITSPPFALIRKKEYGNEPQAKYVATLVIYLLVAVIGAYPEIAEPLDIKAIQMEAILLILLVLVGHGLVWDFMVRRPPGGEHARGSDT